MKKYEYIPPYNVSSPIIITSPHSGRHYPKEFNFACTLNKLRRLEDAYVDKIVQSPQTVGQAHILNALFPRSYIDPNRNRNRLAPHKIPGGLNVIEYEKNTDGTPAFNGNHGLIFLSSKINNFEIYTKDKRPTEQEILKRLTLWDSYHEKLTSIFQHASKHHKKIYHLDVHSCWRRGKSKNNRKSIKRQDIILSNNNGQTCSWKMVSLIKNIAKNHGYSVGINNPFKGGYIVQKYGAPNIDRHSLQIEFVRALYMNENTLKLQNKGLQKIHNFMDDVTLQLSRGI